MSVGNLSSENTHVLIVDQKQFAEFLSQFHQILADVKLFFSLAHSGIDLH